MAEFHKNQIAWDTPEAKKVTLAKPDYGYVADALDNLADKAARVANTERVRLDDSIKADLDHEVELINQDLDNMRSATGDFDGFENEAINRLHNVLANYDEDTRRRFLSKNPYYINNTRLATKEKILERKRAIFENEVENNLPLWTSQAAMIGTPEARQEVIHKIQESLGNLSYETTVSDMIFKANQMFDKYNAYRLVTRGDKDSLLEAKKFLASPETSVTIDPYTRVRLEKEINDALIELAKPKKKEDNPNAIAIEKAIANLALAGMWPEVDFIKDQITRSGKSIKTSLGETANLVDGMPIPLFLSLEGLTAEERFALKKDMDNKYKNPNEAAGQTEYDMKVGDMYTDYISGFDNKTTDASAAILGLENAMNDEKKFSNLKGTPKEDIVRAVTQYREAKTELMTSDSMPFRRGKYYDYRSESEDDLADALKAQMQMISEPGGRERLFMQNGRIAPSIARDYNVPQTKESLRDAIKPMREMYYKDIKDDTIGEYTLMLWKQMSKLKQTGLLEGTRFDATQDAYTKFFDSYLGHLNGNGIVNKRTDVSDIENFKQLLTGMLGEGVSLNEKEKAIIDIMIGNASTAQKFPGAVGWSQYLFDGLSNFFSLTGNSKAIVPSGAKPNPELRTLEVAQNMSSNVRETRKALKK